MPFDFDNCGVKTEGEVLHEIRLAQDSDPKSTLTPQQAYDWILKKRQDSSLRQIIEIQHDQNQRIEQLENKNRNRCCVIS